MTNKTYNNIIALLSFMTTIGFVILKIFDIITKSWWYGLIPFGLAVIFREGDDEEIDDDDNGDEPNNNLKMA